MVIVLVNDEYDIEYKYSELDATKYFGREFSMILWKKTNTSKQIVFRVDNSHPINTKKGAPHMHTDGYDHFSIFLGGTNKSNFEEFKKQFLEEAVKQTGISNKDALERALRQVNPF